MWRAGKVSVIDYEKGIVRCTFPDTSEQSGELIVLMGRSTGRMDYSMPELDEVGACLLDKNGNGFYLGSGYTKAFLKPSEGGQDKEITKYKDGSIVEFNAKDSTFKIYSKNKITIEAENEILLKSKLIKVEGPQKNTETITAEGIIKSLEDVIAQAISLIGHLHGGVQGGPSKTGGPE
ncbi:baseplate assembly protein [Cetobacterium somerae]|uniref:baseplate assembly protein n=1 Tax=Cetobacterium somerae TaxID=188913 RepID=UPI002E7C4853|nr:baseplate assembly protein [Cetobacterium somerae]WVJ01811.1 baseplate assembly protein [Cetobacterium somerae]